MGLKEGGKVWKIIKENEKKYKTNYSYKYPNSQISRNTINFTRRIIPLDVEDTSNIINRNLIIQRHTVFRKESNNEYNDKQLQNIFELLFKNKKGYHIQRRNFSTTHSSDMPFYNNNQTTVTNYINKCNTSYNKKSKQVLIKNYKTDQITDSCNNFNEGFNTFMKSKICYSDRGLSKDVVQLLDTDNEIFWSNEHYLKNKMLGKLQRKFPFYKRSKGLSVIKLDMLNNYKLYKEGSITEKNSLNSTKMSLNNSGKKVAKYEMYRRHKEYFEELRNHFRKSNCKRFLAFKSKLKRSCGNVNNSFQLTKQNVTGSNNIQQNLTLPQPLVPRIKHLFIRNKNKGMKSNIVK